MPELRFPEFSGEWEEKIVEDLIKEDILEKPLDGNHGNLHPTASDFVSEGIPFIMACDLKNGKVDTINCNFIKKDQADSLQKGFSKEGDVLFSHKATIGQTAIVKNINTEYIMLTPQVTYYRIKDYSKINNYFLKFYFDSPKFQKLFNLWAIGSTRSYLGISKQQKLPILFPKLAEQEKIASFLSKVDEKIEKLEKKQELWETYKKGMMQKIFSQELRFKDENGEEYPDWEEKKLGDLIESSSSNLSINNLEENNGKYPLYGAIGFMKNLNFYEKDEKYIAIVKDGAGVGRTFLCPEKSSILGTMQYLTSKDQNELIFTYYLISNMNFKKYIIGSTIPHIYYKDYSKEKIIVPTFSEQKKIANLLGDIDLKIDQIIKETKITKEFKKGLLQKLFC